MSSKQQAQGPSRRKQKGAANSSRSKPKPSGLKIGLMPNAGRYPSTQAVGKLSPYHRQLITQIVTPGASGSSMVIAPSRGAQPVCSRHIHKEVDISAAVYPSGVTVVMKPDVHSPSYISAAGAGNWPSAIGPVTSSGTLNYGTGEVFEAANFTMKNPTDGSILQGAQLVTVAGIDYYGFLGWFDKAIHINVQNQADDNSAPNIVFYEFDGVGVNQLVAFDAIGSGEAQSWKGTFGMNAGLLWRVNNPNHPIRASVHIDISAAQITTSPTVTLNKAFQEFETDARVTCGRLVSMSMLLTNTTPLLDKGGTINVGRVPPNFNILSNKIAQEMANLPDNRRHQSGADFGGFTWWFASEVDAFDIDGIHRKTQQYRESEFLLANIQGWPAGSSFKIHFDWVFEFYTDNQLFEKELPPPLDAKFMRILFTLARVQAATCNPEHSELFQKVLDTGAKAYNFAKGAVDHIEKYGPIYMAALEALASLI